MELAVVFNLNPPVAIDVDAPISYTCQECGESVLSYNVEQHARGAHGSKLYVLRNRVLPPEPVVPPSEVSIDLINISEPTA